jgi:succinate dehydrogenase/fumarate reductase flavoprotein subunit
MSKHVGVLRTPVGMQSALDALSVAAEKVDVHVAATRRNFEATNILTVATAVTASALARTESRGCHRRTDATEQRDVWVRHLEVSLHENSLSISGMPTEA